ncbi:hypothetical protein F8M41_001882 [Gigaspora margarita]|uniref:Uncharacterized protein n=1 Tax=Gigaspora margarita TaxID=4874 RepID=A0A8H4A8P3_GIGMA|nr:hypothetical protein F8M41_001882 [Gigaspora margarita]
MTSSISYTDLSQKITDCALPSDEDNLEQDYINNLEHEDYINSVSCTYNASVLSNYTLPTSSSGIISNKHNDSISDNYIGSASKSDSEAIENHKTQNSKNTLKKISLLNKLDNEGADKNGISQNSEDTLRQNKCFSQTTDKISSRTWQKVDVNPKKHSQRLENPLPKQVQKENIVLPLQSTIHNRLQRIQKAKIGSKTR